MALNTAQEKQQLPRPNQIPHIVTFKIGYVIYQQLPDGNFNPTGVDSDTIQLNLDANNAEEAMQMAKAKIEEVRELWTKNQLESKQQDST